MTKSPGAAAPTPTGEYKRHDDFVPYLLNYVVCLINTDFQPILRRYQLSLPQWRVLAFLHDRDGLPIGQLARHTATDQTTLSRIITQMESNGLVERRLRPGDNRFVEVFLTEHGRTTFKRIRPVAVELGDRYLAGFSRQEAETLVTSLKRIVANIEAE